MSQQDVPDMNVDLLKRHDRSLLRRLMLTQEMWIAIAIVAVLLLWYAWTMRKRGLLR